MNNVLQAQPRPESGKQAAKRLRRSGMVPGIYYTHGQQAVPFSVNAKELRNTIRSKSSILDLSLDNAEAAKCVIREVQWDPVKGDPLHVDLLGVTLTEKVAVEVPIQIVGTAAGAKEGGVLQQLLRELEIECLPLDIPEAVKVDVSELKIHDSVHVSDLKLEKIEILNDPNQVILSVLAPRLEEEPAAEAAAEEAEPEVIGHGKKEEAEAEEESK